MNHVDPPDLTLWPTIRHLYPLWRAQWRLVAHRALVRARLHGLSLLIPILIQRTIDDAIDGGDRSLLVPYLAAIVVVAALRFGVNFTRRYATARIGITVEARLRSMLYAAYLCVPARVLRPPRDRRGDLARDERHLPRALLHRLGRRPGDPERADARRRRDRAHDRQREARAHRGRRDAADRGPHLLLRAPGVPDLARGAAQEGPPHRGVGRGRRRDRDGAGVRPRGRRPRPLPRPRRGRAPRDDAAGVGRGALPPRASSSCRRSASPPCCSSAAARRSPATSRSASSRCSSRCCCSSSGRSRRSAGSSTSASARPRPRRAASPGSTGSSRCPSRAEPVALPAGPLHRAVRGRPLPLRDRQRGALGDRPRGRTRRDRRRLRRRRGRARRRCSTCCRASTTPPPAACCSAASTPRRRARGAAAVGRDRDAEGRALLGAAARQPARRAARRRLERRARRVRGGRRRRVRRRPAGRLRHADRRARRQPLRRPAPARRARARADRRRARDRARRPDVGGRHRDRAPPRRAPAPGRRGRTVLISGQRLSTVLVADRAVVVQDGRDRRAAGCPRS